MRFLSLSVLLFLSGCQFFDESKHALQDLGKAQIELSKTFNVQVSITFKAEDLESARHAKVRLQKKPVGLSRQEIERDVNIVLHKFVPRIEKVVVTYSAP